MIEYDGEVPNCKVIRKLSSKAADRFWSMVDQPTSGGNAGGWRLKRQNPVCTRIEESERGAGEGVSAGGRRVEWRATRSRVANACF